MKKKEVARENKEGQDESLRERGESKRVEKQEGKRGKGGAEKGRNKFPVTKNGLKGGDRS